RARGISESKKMSRSYEYHSSSSSYYGGDSKSSTDEYLERINRMLRTPTVITDFPHFPNVHEVLNNNSTYVEEHEDHQKKISQLNHQTPEVHKKVHIVEHEKTTEVGRDGKREDKTIDVEADESIQKKHKNFGLYKWFTLKVY
ncbi:hypothetical protein Pfo_020801, partial [Paulownia fortunei]